MVDHGTETVYAGAGQSTPNALLHYVKHIIHHAGGELALLVAVHGNSLQRKLSQRVKVPSERCCETELPACPFHPELNCTVRGLAPLILVCSSPQTWKIWLRKMLRGMSGVKVQKQPPFFFFFQSQGKQKTFPAAADLLRTHLPPQGCSAEDRAAHAEVSAAGRALSCKQPSEPYLVDSLPHEVFLHGDVVANELLHGAAQ